MKYMNPCSDFDNCRSYQYRCYKYPTDKHSLYADRIYDRHNINQLCYLQNPIEIIEGFNLNGSNIMNFIKLVVAIFIIALIITLLWNGKKEVVKMDIESPKFPELKL